MSSATTEPPRPDAEAAPPKSIRLADYRPPAYLVDHVDLSFALDPERTIVKSRLAIRRAAGVEASAPLILDGEGLDLLSIAINGDALPPQAYSLAVETLTIHSPPHDFMLDIETACAPAANTALSGLYMSNGMFCTQCEAEGFRRITYYPDRPDCLSRFTVRIEADKGAYPVLLSNGNRLAAGDLPGGRHYAQWADPHPKPSYLFALVGGDLMAAEDAFVTRSGRKVALKVFVQAQNIDKCGYTLDSLKRAMKWDEDVFGREYDLDIFMIVAVDHFNFGAMENKGLNIFNSAYVLASPETATDADYESIESIVAHEYFHNWSGNRVTCRDWFQLCLKEGFTVFRDQEFSADMRSRAVQRIKDVRRLWAQQFPEDSGPLAHPVRPESYITIDNFYTATVYEKGAELCRMIKTILGPEKFRKGTDLYFARHDGEAATVENFVKAMEDASGEDLTQFRRWYSDAGAPTISVRDKFESSGGYALTLAQATKPTPGQNEKPPRDIPVSFALVGSRSGAILDEGVLRLKDAETTKKFGPYRERPIASILRGYSAPARVDQTLSLDDRLSIATAEPDLFSRWAATEALWRDLSLAFAGVIDMTDAEGALARFGNALGASIESARGDPAFAAELLKAPSEAELAQHAGVIDPEKIAAGRKRVRQTIAATLQDQMRARYRELSTNLPYDPSAPEAGRRALRNASMSLLVAAGDYAAADEQAQAATNMTDEAAATAALAMSEAPMREAALQRFYFKWRNDKLVANKWLGWRAMAPADRALGEVRALLDHEAFDFKTPNKVRALIGVFSAQNLPGFHRTDGEGYTFFADQLLAIDRINPQLAARLTTSLESWRRLEPVRRRQAEAALRRVAGTQGISANLIEMTSRLIGDPPKG
ncbi:MAG: aminopeptidase N [Alphaproteobacteria bacterium RIFCSPHIGHO2_12_FULL_63_12]|nr:MAG: aminopeptidase N [Alphaproteobacteria bacterium RIFCSPHIGHO2_12_FULL_63_12]